MDIILLSVLAHVTADVIFQSENMLVQKRENKLNSYLKHGIIVFLIMLLFLHYYNLEQIIKFSVIITIIHLLIDWLKNNISLKRSSWDKLWISIADQLIHIFAIIFIYSRYHFYVNKNSFVPAAAFLNNHPVISVNIIVVIAISYIYTLFGGALVVRMVLDCINVKPSNEEVVQNTGKYIGIVERAIILTLTLNNALSAVGFVIAAKSIARFSELNNRAFAEYYLIGTLVSVLIAVSIGLLVLKVFFPLV